VSEGVYAAEITEEAETTKRTEETV
jgi:hypothetical protein